MFEVPEKSNSEKRVIIYCRESRDDYMENYDRIETQRDLLIKFCERNGYTNIVDIIMHDDETGTDFSRLDKIKNRVINDEVDVLVMKDSSRLGRNQLESLKFVELLEEYNVELIFEGRPYDEDFFPLEAWFNERRAKDDSRKIRTNLRNNIELEHNNKFMKNIIDKIYVDGENDNIRIIYKNGEEGLYSKHEIHI